MCGIAGIVGKPWGEALRAVPAAARALQHRGPDDGAFSVFENGESRVLTEWPQTAGMPESVFIHRRLSILDLQLSGRQPMRSVDGRYTIAFNGEIYNYIELREELESAGYRFRSTGDTEVLLAAFAQWGEGAFARLTGMFAFAILDTVKRTVTLARDHFGIKPLYYCVAGGALYFASEIPALMELAPARRGVDAAQLYRYLRFGITDDGTATLFSHIRQIGAASFAVVSLDDAARVDQRRYWQPSIETDAGVGFAEAASEVRRLFLESVNLHLRSDVPVGSALSGGIDSSAVVCAMRALNQDLDLHTFSYIAAGSPLNEERWVDIVAAHTHARVHKVQPEPGELLDDLTLLTRAQGEPFRSTSIFAQYRVFQEAASAGIKVVLDGQGADELLGGYRGFLGVRLASLIRSGNFGTAAAFYRTCVSSLGVSGAYLAQKAAEFLLPAQVQGPLRRIVGRELLPPWMNQQWFRGAGVHGAPAIQSQGRPLLKTELLHELQTTSLPSLLRYEDRNSMAFSIESRVPFLTPKFAEYILRLPDAYIIGNDGTTKRVFREAMRGIVPDAILDRKDKIGFATPEEAWLQRLGGWIESMLQSEAARSVPALDLATTRRMWEETMSGRRRLDFDLWRALNVIHWTRQFNLTYA